MKVVLISPYNDITSMGIRSISACLKKAGHQTRLIFLASRLPAGTNRFESNTLEQLVKLCDKSDLIGISLMTNFFVGMADLTLELKSKLNIPIIWGGIHTSSCPEECLQHADMICMGDGEEAMVELANRLKNNENLSSTMNIWSSTDKGVIRNPLRPLSQDLDNLPFPDYDLEDDYVLDEISNNIIKMDKDIYKNTLESGPAPQARRNQFYYQTLTSRGCPHNCSYCWNSTFMSLYAGEKYLRWRSPESVMVELTQIKEKYDFINLIIFSDDTLLMKPKEEIKRFCHYYKEKIGLPFSCLGSPQTITEEKMEYLVDAGLTMIEMGIESGSLQTRNLYNRKVSNDRILKAARIIDKYRFHMEPPFYDFLLDNPFESSEDQLETLKFITQLPLYSRLNIFSLVMFPGTDLYKRAKKENLIIDDSTEIYRNQTYIFSKKGFINFLFYLARYSPFTRKLLPFVLKERYFKMLVKIEPLRIYQILYLLLESFPLIKKGAIALIRGDIYRITNFLRKTSL